MSVVITIILLITTVTVWSLSGAMKNQVLGHAATVVKQGLEMARSQAGSGRPVLVRFVPFLEKVAGRDAAGGDKTTDVLRWRVEVIDSDGDGDGKLDEDGDGFDFSVWPSFQPLSENATPLIPPVNGLLGPEDDKEIASFVVPAGTFLQGGTNWDGNPAGEPASAFLVFNADGTFQIRKPDDFTLIAAIATDAFRADPAANHDLKVLDGSGEAIYFDLVGTGRINLIDPRK